MKQSIFIGILALTSVMTGEAMAACSPGGGWSRVRDLSGILGGKTVCSLDGQGTQEEHHGTGTGTPLYDYKCGTTEAAPSPPATWCQKPDTDRRKLLGTWTVTGNNTGGATVQYFYDQLGPAFTTPQYKVFVDTAGTTYDFCNGTTPVGTFTLEPITSGTRTCPEPTP